MREREVKPVRFGFLLLSNYSMIAVSSAVEVLRMANQLGRQEFYQWPTYTIDGKSVLASNGLEIAPGNKLADAGHLDVLFVCSGMRVQEQWSDEISRQLHRFKSRQTILGGLCTGTYILAKAGLLDGYRSTIHLSLIHI